MVKEDNSKGLWFSLKRLFEAVATIDAKLTSILQFLHELEIRVVKLEEGEKLKETDIAEIKESLEPLIVSTENSVMKWCEVWKNGKPYMFFGLSFSFLGAFLALGYTKGMEFVKAILEIVKQIKGAI